MLKRILSGAGANAYSQLVTIVIQLASLPIFLTVWNLETYGIWLAISTIPAYVTLSDVGMVTATGNRLNMLLAKGLKEEANSVFQSSLVFMMIACSTVALTVFILLQFIDIPPGTKTPAIILSLSALLALFGGLAEAIYKATYRYAYGAFIAATIRLVEWLGLLIGLWYGENYTSAALGTLTARCLGTIFLILNSRGEHGIHWGIKAAQWAEVRTTIKPAIAFMAFPITNAFSIQGVTLVVATALGPAVLAIFNAYRTLARVTVQGTSIVSHALWPEFTRLYIHDPDSSLLKIYNRSFWLGIVIALVGCSVVYLVSPFILNYWSKGKIEFVASLMGTMMLYAFIASAWHVPRVLMMATSRHTKLAIWSVCIACLTTLSTYIVAIVYKSSVEVAATLAVYEGLLASYAIFAARRILEKNL